MTASTHLKKSRHWLSGLGLERTRGEIHVGLVITAVKRIECACHLAAEVLAAVHALALQVLAQLTNVIFIAIKDGCLTDAKGAAGVGTLAPGVPQAFTRLPTQQHRWNVVNLVSCFGARTLLRLRHTTPLAPAFPCVQDQHQAQDRKQQSNHPTLQKETER